MRNRHNTFRIRCGSNIRKALYLLSGSAFPGTASTHGSRATQRTNPCTALSDTRFLPESNVAALHWFAAECPYGLWVAHRSEGQRMAHHVQTLWWLQNRADGYILRNRIQMQQKPQRRNSFTLRLNGCRADFQNRNIRVCCMDGIMDGTDILPLAAFYPCECHRLFSAIGIAGYGKQMVRVAMNTSNFLGQTSLCKSSIAQSRMCCIALFSASGNPSVQKCRYHRHRHSD